MRFGFRRYKGTSAKLLHDKVKAVEVLDAHRLRFVLHAPGPTSDVLRHPRDRRCLDCPQKYLEQVGDDGFQRHPIGLRPYRFVSMTPGVELVFEANEQYWRKMPSIKRIVFKGVPERLTRLAMLQDGGGGPGHLYDRRRRAAVKGDPKLRLGVIIAPVTWWLEFPEQWATTSPWHDRRVRLAATLAIDSRRCSRWSGWAWVGQQARSSPRLRVCPVAGAVPIRPSPGQAPAGGPATNGFEAGDLTPLPPFVTMGEAVGNYLGAVGIRTVAHHGAGRVPLGLAGRKLQGLILNASGALGNAATRIETFVISTAPYAYGGYPDLDDLFRQQAVERQPGKREMLLHQMQRLMQQRIMHAPIFEPAVLHGVGPQVEEPGAG